jgi:apolipoprotein N-acyltransferase
MRLAKSRWLPHPGTLLSGVLLAFAFAPWNFHALSWVALVPWLFALESARLRDSAPASRRWAALREGLWLSVFMALGNFYWIAHTLRQFAQLPWALAILGLLLFSLICQPQFPLFAPLWLASRERSSAPPGSRSFEPPHRSSSWALLGRVAVSSLAYAGLDRYLPKLFVDTLGHAFHAAPLLRQAADLGGAWLLTFVAFFVNQAFFLGLVSAFPGWVTAAPPGKNGEKAPSPGSRILAGPAPTLAAAALLVAATLLYGKLRSGWIERYFQTAEKAQAPAPAAELAVIQANIGDIDKLAAESGYREAADRIVEAYLALSREAVASEPRPHALVWPETSYPSAFRVPRSSAELLREQRIEAFARDNGIPIWFGGYDRRGGKDFNSLFFLAPNLELQTYHKSILLLFGEYIPGMESLPWLLEAFPQIGNFGRGAGPSVFSLPTTSPQASAAATTAPPQPELWAGAGLPAQPLICYEALFPDFAIEGARKGAKLLLNVTNDSWFGPWGEPHTHLSLTVFRSIETRLPQLRATNTGISALILPSGEIAARTGLFEPGVLRARVRLHEPPWTLMKQWGDWFGLFSLVTGLLPLALLALRQRVAGGSVRKKRQSFRRSGAP